MNANPLYRTAAALSVSVSVVIAAAVMLSRSDDPSSFEVFKWVTTAAAVTGVVLNIRKSHRSYYLWMHTNVAWVVIDVYHRVWSQAALQAVYFVLSCWGAYMWRRKHKESIMDSDG